MRVAPLLSSALVCLVLGAPSSARAADDDDEAPPPRTWDFGARLTGGTATVDRAHLCILQTPCPQDDHYAFSFFGAELDASYGRAPSHVRWLSSLELAGGGGQLGSLFSARLSTGMRFLSDPKNGGGFLLEIVGGPRYYDFLDADYASAGMLGAQVTVGVRFDRVKLLASVRGDTFVFESVGAAAASLGFVIHE